MSGVAGSDLGGNRRGTCQPRFQDPALAQCHEAGLGPHVAAGDCSVSNRPTTGAAEPIAVIDGHHTAPEDMSAMRTFGAFAQIVCVCNITTWRARSGRSMPRVSPSAMLERHQVFLILAFSVGLSSSEPRVHYKERIVPFTGHILWV